MQEGKNVDFVDLQEQELTSLPPLDLQNVSKLVLNGNQLQSLSLTRLRKVCQLSALRNKLEELQVPVGQTSFTTIDISFNRFRTFRFGVFSNLQELDISFNKLAALDFFDCLPALKVLKASNNLITSASVPNGFVSKIEELDLSRNQLSSLSFMRTFSFPRLEQLSVSYNDLTDLSSLCEFQNLSHFDVSHNRVSVLFKKTQSSLIYLNLESNALKGIQQLASAAPSLTSLDLANNQISLFSDLSPIQQLESLEEISLKGNPIYHENISDLLIELNPNIDSIDGEPIGNEPNFAEMLADFPKTEDIEIELKKIESFAVFDIPQNEPEPDLESMRKDIESFEELILDNKKRFQIEDSKLQQLLFSSDMIGLDIQPQPQRNPTKSEKVVSEAEKPTTKEQKSREVSGKSFKIKNLRLGLNLFKGTSQSSLKAQNTLLKQYLTKVE